MITIKLLAYFKSFFLLVLLVPITLNVVANNDDEITFSKSISSSYKALNLSTLNYYAFELAVRGHQYYKNNNQLKSNIIAIIDFDLPSSEKRLYIIDLTKNIVLHVSLVAHGKKSGLNYASNFSNKTGSHQSSLGFFITKEKYTGKHGLSLRLDGLEKGVNDLARKRNIVIHSAKYVSDNFVLKNKRLGRSFGCPALPLNDYQEVIDYLDDEILIFIYSSTRVIYPEIIKE